MDAYLAETRQTHTHTGVSKQTLLSLRHINTRKARSLSYLIILTVAALRTRRREETRTTRQTEKLEDGEERERRERQKREEHCAFPLSLSLTSADHNGGNIRIYTYFLIICMLCLSSLRLWKITHIVFLLLPANNGNARQFLKIIMMEKIPRSFCFWALSSIFF